jgi:hypothetical protein
MADNGAEHAYEEMDAEADPVAVYVHGAHAKFRCKKMVGRAHECICMLKPDAGPPMTACELLALTMYDPDRKWTLILSNDAFLSLGGKGPAPAPLVAIDDPVIMYGTTGVVPQVLAVAMECMRKKHNKTGALHSIYRIKPDESWPDYQAHMKTPEGRRWYGTTWMAEFDCRERLATVCTMDER